MYYLVKLVPGQGKDGKQLQVPIYSCPELWPLALFLAHMDKEKYRIVKRR